MDDQQPPVAIGGVGGSGTRLIASIIQQLGFYIGSDLNGSMDNLLFTLLFKRPELWSPENNQDEINYLIRLFTQYMHEGKNYSHDDIKYLEKLADQDRVQHKSGWLKQRLEKFSEPYNGKPNKTWGWKEPNTHIFLPIISQVIPNLKYIHVVRHGLDMAYSSNQNQLQLWGPEVFGKGFDTSTAESAFIYWVWAHKRIKDTSIRMGNRLMLISFEDFCTAPEKGIREVIDFLDLEAQQETIDSLSKEIKTPKSISRYKELLDFTPNKKSIDLLESFGYSL